MAAVYRAHDTALRRDVALKVLYPQYRGDAALVERFQREAVLAANLDHPNILPIYDVGEAAGLVYIAMRLLSGRSFADTLRMRGALPPAELVPIIEQIASALDYAHARQIVHRDIKPANILIEGMGDGRWGWEEEVLNPHLPSPILTWTPGFRDEVRNSAQACSWPEACWWHYSPRRLPWSPLPLAREWPWTRCPKARWDLRSRSVSSSCSSRSSLRWWWTR
jgi:serine/threonine protein kinase